jgi:hypothetical protein
MYNVHVPYRFLWSNDGSFDRRRWPPRAQAATVVNEESFRFVLASFNNERLVVKMHWEIVIDAKGRFRLRAEWDSLQERKLDS